MYMLLTVNNSANFTPNDLPSTSYNELFNLLFKYAYINECGKSFTSSQEKYDVSKMMMAMPQIIGNQQ